MSLKLPINIRTNYPCEKLDDSSVNMKFQRKIKLRSLITLINDFRIEFKLFIYRCRYA